MTRRTRVNAVAQYQAQRDFDGRADLALITAATLVLSGSAERLVSAADATELTTGIAAHPRQSSGVSLLGPASPAVLPST